MSSCYCTGPIKGEPLCPCMMRIRGIFQRDGKWFEPEHEVGKPPTDLYIRTGEGEER